MISPVPFTSLQRPVSSSKTCQHPPPKKNAFQVCVSPCVNRNPELQQLATGKRGALNLVSLGQRLECLTVSHIENFLPIHATFNGI